MKKYISICLLLIISLFFIAGCQSQEVNESQVETKTVEDRYGNQVNMPESMEKIISASASNTEILVGLGMGDKIIAYDEYASDVEGVNSEAVTMDFRSPDLEKIISMDPDVIFANDYNKAGQEDPFSQLTESGIPVIYIPSSTSIDEIYEDISFFGEITGKSEKAQEIIDNMKTEIAEFEKISSTIENKKRVYFEINPAPSITTFGGNTFLGEVLRLVGAENIFESSEGWITPNEELVISENPDVIITNVNFIDNPIDEIKSRPGWNSLDAVKNDQVFTVLTNETSRATQNVVKGIESVAKAIYPEYYGE